MAGAAGQRITRICRECGLKRVEIEPDTRICAGMRVWRKLSSGERCRKHAAACTRGIRRPTGLRLPPTVGTFLAIVRLEAASRHRTVPCHVAGTRADSRGRPEPDRDQSATSTFGYENPPRRHRQRQSPRPLQHRRDGDRAVHQRVDHRDARTGDFRAGAHDERKPRRPASAPALDRVLSQLCWRWVRPTAGRY